MFLKHAIHYLLQKNHNNPYDPEYFLNYFCQNNSNFDFIKGAQCCSQDFNRTLIRNINNECINDNKNNNVYSNFKFIFNVMIIQNMKNLIIIINVY